MRERKKSIIFSRPDETSKLQRVWDTALSYSKKVCCPIVLLVQCKTNPSTSTIAKTRFLFLTQWSWSCCKRSWNEDRLKPMVFTRDTPLSNTQPPTARWLSDTVLEPTDHSPFQQINQILKRRTAHLAELIPTSHSEVLIKSSFWSS